MADISKVADLCAMASSKPPREWTRDVIKPVPGSRHSIFGDCLFVSGALDWMDLVEALLWTDLAQSRTQAKTAILAGAVRINGEQCKTPERRMSNGDILPNLGAIVLENGRRNYGVIVVCGT